MNWFIAEATADHVMGTYANLVFVVWRRSIQYSALERLRALVTRVVEIDGSVVPMIVAEEGCALPTAAQSEIIASIFAKHTSKVTSGAMVHAGSPNQALAVRSTAASIAMLRPNPAPIRTFGDVREAITFVAPNVRTHKPLRPIDLVLFIEQARLTALRATAA